MTTQENMLARHRILHELGRGAIGVVYAARDRTTGAVVALKRLDPLLLKSDATLADRFLKHARSAQRLGHHNIVKIHDAGEAAGTAYVAMEMLEGENLRKILDEGPLPVARAIQLAHEIACGLAHAHLEAVVHGGVKPSNIIVLRSGAVKITDFGIGQLGHAALLSGARAGCLSCMSPEQVRGDPVDHRCDIFSLGALLYEMLTRRPPFEGDSPKEVMENILRAEPPPPSALNQHVPRALDAIVLSMLAGQPAARPPGVPILLRELQRLEEGLGLGAGAGSGEPTVSVPPADPGPGPRTPEPSLRVRPDRARFVKEPKPERSSGSRAAMFAALALVVAVLSVGLTVLLNHWPGPSERRAAASRMQEAPAPATAAAPSRSTAPPPLAEDATAEQDSPGIAAAAATGAAPAQEVPQATQPTPNDPQPQPGGRAQLILAVSPRGELYIDGEHHGTTPPVTTLDLEPGMHRIEVRSGSRKPYLTYMTVQAGDVRHIRHDFNAKPSRPPAESASWRNSNRPARQAPAASG